MNRRIRLHWEEDDWLLYGQRKMVRIVPDKTYPDMSRLLARG
jgi:hypothetical protein